MITLAQAQELKGRQLVTTSGDKVGKIGQIFLDDETGQPEWVTVDTGLFGTKESFVPLQDAEYTEQGLSVPYDKSRIKDAPNIDVEAGHLSRDEEAQLYDYYGLSYSTADSDNGYNDGINAAAGQQFRSANDVEADFGGTTAGNTAGTVGYDTSGPTTDDAMTRSEESIRVGTETVETGRARLRKYIVTENVTQTVPVSREEVRIEREPITEANMGNAMSGPELSEEEHEVVLHAERPVVQKDVNPVERVRLDTETVTETETVSEQVRKEQIDIDDESGTNNRF